MSDGAKPTVCAPTDALHRDEQTVCRPGTKNNYIAKVDSNAASFMKYYRVSRDDLSRTVTRVHVWDGVVDLSKGAYSFGITSSSRMSLTMKVRCTEGKCDTIKMYWLNKDSFDKANKSGTFDEDMFGAQQSDFTSHKTFTESLDSSAVSYLVFANKNQASVIDYNLTISYVVFDTSSFTPVACTNDECSFEDVTTSEAIVMEYIDTEEKGPEYVGAEIKSEQKSVAGAVFIGIVFMALSLGCLVFFILFVLQALGKISLYTKKPIQKQEGKDNSRYEAPDIAGDKAVRVSEEGRQEP